MKRLVGFDLNGWNDASARNWTEKPGEDTVWDQKQIIRGGIGGVIVAITDHQKGEPYVGGMQALRAPHGRGPGWGAIGQVNKRISVTDLLCKPATYQAEIASALGAMADARKAFAVLAIPDTLGTGEDYQDALLNAMRQLRPRRSLLVWRPVLAVLAALDQGLLENTDRVCVIGHCGSGFTTQTLKIRQGIARAPERKKTGCEYRSSLGLNELLGDARKALKARSHVRKCSAYISLSPNAWNLALGYPARADPIRHDNGQWELITPPEPSLIDLDRLPTELSGDLDGCDRVLLETPLVGTRRGALRDGLAQLIGRSVDVLGPEDIANGALEAARRLAENLPVYFDFLPQISTIVQEGTHAANYDLIPHNALLPAGSIYRSEKPARLGLQAGSGEIKVHLLKEGTSTPRRAVVSVSVPPSGQVPVALHVEQAPASGSAKLTLESEAFSGPLVVNWDNAEEINMPWKALIDSLKPHMPTIPNRLILPCGMESWVDRARRPGLHSLLDQTLPPDWETLANKLANRPYGFYGISSDGDLPSDLSKEAVGLLEKATRLAELHVRGRLDGTNKSTENHSLRFLTWLFPKCPDWVVQPMLDALEAEIGQHVFVQKHQNRTLMLQGLGRIAREPKDQRRIFDHLLGLPLLKWKKDQMACAAFLLSRTDSAPKLITPNEVEYIGDVVDHKLHEAIGQDFTSKYSYGPFLLVGLLRRRLVDPWALVAGRDPLADQLLRTTQGLVDDLASHMDDRPHLKRYHTVLVQVCDELSGKGSNPDILVDLENLTRGAPKTDDDD